MDQKQAILRAKEYIREIFMDEDISSIGLEEIERSHHDGWKITIGFNRKDESAIYNLLAVSGKKTGRTYKVLEILPDGEIVYMRNR